VDAWWCRLEGQAACGELRQAFSRDSGDPPARVVVELEVLPCATGRVD
ncbi:uncharacterized protein METZ01_LOCUS198109, partial [marine metagenome]